MKNNINPWDQTPDLSGSFNPIPKVFKAKKAPKPLGPGKKTKEWDDVREILKKQFLEQGIAICELKLEGCWKNNALTFAHIDKRINLTKEDLYKVVLACTPCHQIVEQMPAKEMRLKLVKIIKNREY